MHVGWAMKILEYSWNAGYKRMEQERENESIIISSWNFEGRVRVWVARQHHAWYLIANEQIEEKARRCALEI